MRPRDTKKQLIEEMNRRILEESLVYDEETKTMSGDYKVLGEDDEYVTIENVQEFKGFKGRSNIGYMDGKMAGTSKTHVIKLPKSQVTVGESDENGMSKITIPYPIYKKHQKELRISKVDHDTYRVKPE